MGEGTQEVDWAVEGHTLPTERGQVLLILNLIHDQK